MSRSRKRNPIHGIAGDSEKADKKIWHSRLRAREREAIHRGDEIMPEERDVSNPWSMGKDGKFRWEFEDEWDDATKEDWERMMRK